VYHEENFPRWRDEGDMKSLAILLISGAGLRTADARGVTFYRDVLPILQERCQSCHRAGEIGPMPLGSYTEVRPWAKAVRQAVVTRKMPPWNAEGANSATTPRSRRPRSTS
jgi:hypothetical protein